MEKIFQQIRTIPEPIKGISGLLYVDEVLKKRNLSGVLIGGLSELLWTKPSRDFKNKDVDVFILGTPNENTPGQWEFGVDWWLQSSKNLAPSNGTHVCLRWNLLLKNGLFLKPGLYIPSKEIIEEYRQCESGLFLKQTSLKKLDKSIFEHTFLGLPIVNKGIISLEKIQLDKPSLFPKPITY